MLGRSGAPAGLSSLAAALGHYTSRWGPFKCKVLSSLGGPSPSFLGSQVNKLGPQLLTWPPPVPGTSVLQVCPLLLYLLQVRHMVAGRGGGEGAPVASGAPIMCRKQQPPHPSS